MKNVSNTQLCSLQAMQITRMSFYVGSFVMGWSGILQILNLDYVSDRIAQAGHTSAVCPVLKTNWNATKTLRCASVDDSVD